MLFRHFTGDGEWIGVKEEEITVADCKLSFSYRKFFGDHSEPASGDTLKVGEAYWFHWMVQVLHGIMEMEIETIQRDRLSILWTLS